MRTKLATVAPVEIAILRSSVAKLTKCSSVAEPIGDVRLPFDESALSNSALVDTHADPSASSTSEDRLSPDDIGSADNPATHVHGGIEWTLSRILPPLQEI